MSRRFLDYLANRAKQKLRKSEAAMQDFRDLRRKGQVRRDDKLGVERTMDNVNDRMKKERQRFEALREGRLPEKEG